ADSVGGAAWDGTLPNGGKFDGGQLALTAANDQYVNLPAGILSNYTMVTIEAWATFGSLPNACFLYGFGGKNGSDGVNYVFCQPKAGRIALSDSNWSREQGSGGGGDWSGQTVHVTAVFNPPAGYIALYTNGVLVSKNVNVTRPLSVVSNVFSYIGRSLYSGDSYVNVNLDEFRIYNGALTPGEIAATESLGPNQVPSAATSVPGVSVSAGMLTRPRSSDHRHGSLLSQTNHLNHGFTTNWQNVTGSDTATSIHFTVNPSNSAVFYRLRHP
ncbi:MAG TPA: LamG domain-containing protein, partial [Candidatus Binatia bacterium]|nr:LamG domain-containing protein [Candidatus Binatia bacterium]